MKFLSLLCFFFASVQTEAQVLPSSYYFTTSNTLSVNGSSSTGHCSYVTTGIGDGSLSRCDAPTTSVLFDGNIPTLTGLDGDMWASQLLTVQESTMVELIFDFCGRGDSDVELVEVVMFNCPELGISAGVIRLLAAAFLTGPHAGLGTSSSSSITSCDSLVRLCMPRSITLPVITLQFFLPPGSNWVHIAEVTFYSDAGVSTCTSGPVALVATTLSETVETVDSTMSSTVQSPLTFPTQGSDATCSSCSVASVITAIATALLATVIFVLVQIALCKCHPKFKPGGTERGGGSKCHPKLTPGGTEMGGEELNCEAVSDPTYVEVGKIGGNSFQIKGNEAYIIHHQQNN